MTDAHSLQARAFEPLPLGAIRPAGWLRNQLRIQAEGLSGHLDEFWPDVMDSGWIGGKAEGWERGPYWLDGVVPLAFLLDDAGLRAKVDRWMDYILDHQQEDGWLGPVVEYQDTPAYDPWPNFVMLKVMTQYQEVTGDGRIVPAMERFLRRLDALMDGRPFLLWERFRWMDLVLSVHWLYDRTGEAWLLDLARKAHDQGFDWRGHFADFAFKGRVSDEDRNLITHVVNNAMGIKHGGVWWRQSGDEGERAASLHMMAMLDEYHGQATGVFSGDEHLAGRNPSQGTELCAVAEYMFSLEVLMAAFGEPALADRLEKIAFNALPATFMPNMWAHQYDQQANQVLCCVAEDRVYTSNAADANIFGLEPNFGCCTANMHQAWPKFCASLWMGVPKRGDGPEGLAAVAYAPCRVEAEADGRPVVVEVETDYPFDETIRLVVEAKGALALYLRIPAWAEGAEVAVEGEAPAAAEAGTFHVVEREWQGRAEVTLRFPMKARIERRFNESVSISRGPLVYALHVGGDWRQIAGELPHADWEVHPTTPWNYALEVDGGDPAASLTFERRDVGDCPFSPEGAPVVAKARGRRVPEWGLEHNAAAPPPQSPVESHEPVEEVELIPYGCTNLRVTELPVIG